MHLQIFVLFMNTTFDFEYAEKSWYAWFTYKNMFVSVY